MPHFMCLWITALQKRQLPVDKEIYTNFLTLTLRKGLNYARKGTCPHCLCYLRLCQWSGNIFRKGEDFFLPRLTVTPHATVALTLGIYLKN